MLTVLGAKQDKSFSQKPLSCSCDVSRRYLHMPRRTSLVVHVGAGIDTLLRKLRKRDLKTLFNRLQDSLVFGAADERDTETLGSETTGTTDTVEVRVSLIGHIVVDGDVDTLNIDTTSEDISGDTDTGLEILELLVALDTISSLVLEQKAPNSALTAPPGQCQSELQYLGSCIRAEACQALCIAESSERR